MRAFTHYSANSLEEVFTLLERYGDGACLNAGGTDLVTVLRGEVTADYPKAVIDLKTVPGLCGISCTQDTLSIGAMTALAAVASSEHVRGHCPALAAAALAVASPQIRNAGTLGGNLCQNTRCWYYRYPARLNGGSPLMCPRKGGGACLAVRGDNRYHAILGGRRCFAVCPSDTAVALAALGASLVLESRRGCRRVAVEEFYHPLGIVLEQDEVLTAVTIPLRQGRRQSFRKFAQRKAVDFALCSTAAVLEMDGDVCLGGRIALGAVAPGPVCPAAAGQLTGRHLTPELIDSVAEAALDGAKPLSMNGYKVELAKNLVRQALYDLLTEDRL